MAEKEVKPTRMERFGMRYFERMSKKYKHEFSPDEIHVLNAHERKNLMRVQRNSIIRQSVAGAISALISVLIGFWIWPYPGDMDHPLTWEEQIWFYGWLYGLSFIVTAIEIAYLYYDSLRSVHKLANVAGLDLFPADEEEHGVAVTLVRAALELPNPPDDLERVNPRKEIKKWQVFIAAMIYKLKATATNFVLKAVGRKIAGRSGLRAAMEFLAVPVFAFWNGLIAYWVLRQARIRAMGPSAVEEFSQVIYARADEFGETAHLAAFRAIGAAIVRTVDLHPNLIAFMKSTYRYLGNPGEVELDSSPLFLECLEYLPADEQDFALRVYILASILDGKLARREKRLLLKAFEICGYEPDLKGVKNLRKAFVGGRDNVMECLNNCLPSRTESAPTTPS